MVTIRSMTTSTRPTSLAILGLGPMGAAIGRSVAQAGHDLIAWNRTERTLAEHGLAGAGRVRLAESPGQAVAGADAVVICVRDHAASRPLVSEIASAVGGAVVVNLSTGTPAEAAASAAMAAGAGVRYVTGAVMVPTSMVGSDACLVLYAGASDDVRAVMPLLGAIGGVSDVVGEDHAVPPALDLAMLDLYFAGMYAFLHSAALAEAHGIDPARYLPYAEGIVDTLRRSLPELATAIQRRTYDGGEARLDMCLSFLEHIVATSAEVGVPPGIAATVRDASATAMERWPGDTDWDVVAEDLWAQR